MDETLTVITMYRGHDAEMFTQVVKGRLTKEQREETAQSVQLHSLPPACHSRVPQSPRQETRDGHGPDPQ